ncbi:hypothetical protein GCM10022221_73990 [Actinocorallia aurea]
MKVNRRAALALCGAVLAGGVAATAAPAAANIVRAADPYSDKWGVIGRNSIGSPVAELRFGPWGRTTATPAATQPPPSGRGSLGLLVAAGPNPGTATDDEKIAYGNETDFAGFRIADIRALRYSIFTAMDSIEGVSLPRISFEIDPKLDKNVTYSTLVYLPDRSASPSAPASPGPGRWQTYDAAAAGGAWFATGTTGATIGCTLAQPCTFSHAKEKLPKAVVTYAVQFQKGRDNAFIGAVDALRINSTLYDFEREGVRRRPI